MSEAKRGKTETIKERTVYIYLPSLEMVEDWKRRAERVGGYLGDVLSCLDDIEETV